MSCQPSESGKHTTTSYDLVVYGGTSGGIIAAIQAARMNHTVLLIEPSSHLGGMTTGGLVWTDYGIEETIGGLAADFYSRIRDHYSKESAWKVDDPFRESIMSRSEQFMKSFEPHVADSVFRSILKEAAIEVLMGERLLSDEGVIREGNRIKAIRLESGSIYSGNMFIDATYEGDLMAQAGVSYHVGREPKSQYHESLAGVLGEEVGYRQPKKYFGKEVNPYDDNGNLLFGIQEVAMGEPGAGDDKVQAYNIRLCLTTDKNNRIPMEEPDNYDPARYELLARYMATKDSLVLQDLIKISPVPNQKTDINDGCPFSTDYIGANWDYPEGNYQTREEIIRDHYVFTQGLLYFIGHDSRIPESVRQEMLRYGYPKDEFVQNKHITPQVYIREARRMIGEYVMTQQDCQEDTIKETSIGIGSYGVDSHHIQRIVTKEGEVINEGNFLAHHHPYEIPLESILPKQEECENLLVPVCVSSSHIAFGSIRMEPVFMILGQSAATAAVQAIEDGVAVQEVKYKKLQQQLLKDQQQLTLSDKQVAKK